MVVLGPIISFRRGEPLGVRGLSIILYWYFVTTLIWPSPGYYNPSRLGNHQWPPRFAHSFGVLLAMKPLVEGTIHCPEALHHLLPP